MICSAAATYDLGALAGYRRFKEVVNAFGCTQTAGNPEVCQPAIPNAVEAITQNNIWQSPRLGFGGSRRVRGAFQVERGAAWLPYVRLNGTDAHWLRIGGDVGDFAGPIPEDGIGMGYQLEAAFSYDVTPNASVGVGARIGTCRPTAIRISRTSSSAREGRRSRFPAKSDIYEYVQFQASYSSAACPSPRTDYGACRRGRCPRLLKILVSAVFGWRVVPC